MTTQPEALRLADALTQPTYPDWVMHIPAPWHPPAQKVREAAAELRRLHAENERLQERRDALLLECIDIVALHGGSVEIEAAIRAKMGEANEQDYD
jgi:hypothetical protein